MSLDTCRARTIRQVDISARPSRSGQRRLQRISSRFTKPFHHKVSHGNRPGDDVMSMVNACRMPCVVNMCNCECHGLKWPYETEQGQRSHQSDGCCETGEKEMTTMCVVESFQHTSNTRAKTQQKEQHWTTVQT